MLERQYIGPYFL